MYSISTCRRESTPRLIIRFSFFLHFSLKHEAVHRNQENLVSSHRMRKENRIMGLWIGWRPLMGSHTSSEVRVFPSSRFLSCQVYVFFEARVFPTSRFVSCQVYLFFEMRMFPTSRFVLSSQVYSFFEMRVFPTSRFVLSSQVYLFFEVRMFPTSRFFSSPQFRTSFKARVSLLIFLFFFFFFLSPHTSFEVRVLF